MTDRYATNAFTNFADFEKGVFKKNEVDDVMKGDNPDFLYPPKTLRTASGSLKDGVQGSHTQKIQRGYMRMLSQGFKGGSSLARRRLHFQFNPDSIVRHVQARNDVQLWMNQDPVQLMQPIPGDANFAFELLFNREAEVSSGTYRDGSGEPKPSTAKAQIPLGQAGVKNKNGSADIPHSAVTDIGVLADLMVLDDIIGQGINTQLIEKVITNANAINAKKRRDSASKGSTGNNPTTGAQATIELEGNKVKTVKITNGGSGYTSVPKITLSGGGGGTGAKLTAVIENGSVKSVTVDEQGSGYTSVPGVTFTGGGDGSGTSADGTSDTQDIPEEFDVDEATKSLYNNFGNSAFLVSLPVRIVFSSLFMVEGYITSTTVTFNKFNPNMVPTQCAVGIQMQALYIGFARKDTFLTLSLEEGLKAAQQALEASGGKDANPEIAAAEAIGKKLFERTVRRGSTGSFWSPDESDESRENVSPSQIFERKDYVQTIAFKAKATADLKALLGRKSIKEIIQKGSWKITYLGNTNGATPLGNSVGIAKDEVLTEMFKEGKFNLGDLKDKDGDTLKLEFESNPLTADKKVDTTSTSRYQVEFRVNFELVTESGETVPCKQMFIATGIVKFNEKLLISKKGSMIVQVDAWDWKSV